MRGSTFAHGFTLLELLVVLLIVGVIISFATLSIGDGGREAQIRREAERIGALLEMAGDEAVLGARQLGLELRPNGYRFLVHREGAWQVLHSDSVFRERALPPGIRLELLIEGLSVSLGDAMPGTVPRPQVTFYSSGERSPFGLRLYPEAEAFYFQIQAPPLGPAVLQGPVEGS